MSLETQTVTTSLGHKITVFCNDHIGDKIAKRGLYEKESLTFLLELIKQINNPVVLDIGANIGNHTLAFSTVANEVHAFEPLPEIFSLLQENIQQNQLLNAKAHQVALSDENGEATMYMIKEQNIGASSFYQRRSNSEAMTVKQMRGDDLIKELALSHVDLIKMDVESHEVFALQGLMHTLQTYLPFITMEWNFPEAIERMKDSEVMNFLQTNYHMYVLGSNYDRGFWQGRSFAFLRRKLTRLLKPRKAMLYPFDPKKVYKDLLLVPKGKEHYLEALAP